MPSSYRFELLAPGDRGAFAELYRICAEALDPRETKPQDQLEAMAADPDYRFLLARRGAEVVGFSVVLLPPGEPFALLEYMAVASGHRGSGVGAGLFRRSLEIARSPLLVEVDSDREPGPDQDLRRRRKDLYHRLGCATVAGLSYFLPLPGSPPMELMIHRPPGAPDLARQELGRWLGVLYERAYGCSPDDPRIADMMATVDDPVRLVRRE